MSDIFVWHISSYFWKLILVFFYVHRGVGAMEIVAMDMKLRGMYIARQLSFHGVSFKIDDVPLTDKFKKAYDDSVELVGTFFQAKILS